MLKTRLKTRLTIELNHFSILVNNERIDFGRWWELEKNHDTITDVVLDNEKNIDKFFSNYELDARYIFKFMCNTPSTILSLEETIYPFQIVFFRCYLRNIMITNKRISIVFTKDVVSNGLFVKLIREIISEHKDVNCVYDETRTKKQKFTALKLRLYNYAFWAHYLSEWVAGNISGIFKRKISSKNSLILSNYRHYAKTDVENTYWGNFIKLMQMNNTSYSMIYYNQADVILGKYYLNIFKDTKHTFWQAYIKFGDIRKNIFLHKKSPNEDSTKLKSLTFIVDGIDYGDYLKPFIDLFRTLIYPFILKNRAILINLLKSQPKNIFVDSEVNLIAMQLGFLPINNRKISMNFEVISGVYSQLPFVNKSSRPSFDTKVVRSDYEKNILVDKYKYIASKVSVFPDPRFIASKLNPKPLRDEIVMISQILPFFYEFTNKFAHLLENSNSSLSDWKLSFKTHPSENKSTIAVNQSIVRIHNPLDFTPKYAVNCSSTLGIELLFEGSIVFFIDNTLFGIGDYFGLAKKVPFLVCRTPEEVLSKIMMLEKDAQKKKQVLADIKTYLDTMFGNDSIPVLRRKIKRLLKNN